MADRFADHFGRVPVRVYRLRGEFARWAQWRVRYRPDFRNRRVRLHDLRGLAGRAKESGHLASGSRPNLAARASVAGLAQPANDFFSRWFSVWWRADQSTHDLAHYSSGERPVRGSFAALHAPHDDLRSSHGDNFRANRSRARPVGNGSRRAGGRGLWSHTDRAGC